MSPMSKMQLRKELVTLISKYKDNAIVENSKLLEDINYLESLPDSAYVLEFLLKEMVSENSTNANICALFVMELYDKETLERYVTDLLMSKKVADNKKFFLISVLKQKGVKIDYQDISSYISDPDDIAKEGVRKFLKDLIFDPEVQIDLLDFYTNIPEFEKIPLLRSVLNESDADTTSLALSLIVQTIASKENITDEEFKIIIDELIKLKSPYAINGLAHILENFELSKKETMVIRGRIKELEFQFKDFKNNEIIKDSAPFKSYISFIDGQSNFSLIFSRTDKENNFKTFLATCNLNNGVVSCMGFSKINEVNFNAILHRLFTDSMPVQITDMALKGLLNYFVQKNIETKTKIPYEFLIWRNLLTDIKDINFDIIEFIRSKLDTINLDEAKVKKLASSKMLATWYISKNENKKIDKLIDKLENEHITEFSLIEEITSKYIDENFMNDTEFLENLEKRLLILAYIAKLANLKMSSLCAYSLCFKNSYTKIIVSSIIDKSIYYYFLSQYVMKSNENNIFRRRNDSKYTPKELNTLINEFEKKWNQKKD